MKTYAMIEYIFMFDPTETWSHLYEFEKALGDFFKSKGLDAQVVKTVDGASGRRIYIINKKEVFIPAPSPEIGRPKGLKSIIRDVKDTKLKVSTSKVDIK